MKIEIAENLVQSYLKHTEGCRVVQTNWKTSSQWKVTAFDERQARGLFGRIRLVPEFEGIFKNNGFDQLMKQAEIDVLGINMAEQSIFGIDVAFHSSGLNYGDTQTTSLRILKKIFRTVFIMQTYFSEMGKFNSYFVTPKVNPSVEKPILALLEKAREVIEDEAVSIGFISNDDFFSKIVAQVLTSANGDNDTSELFVRAMKLLQLDNRKTVSQNVVVKKPFKSNGTEKRMVQGMKIGQFAQTKMKELFERGLLPPSEIRNLQDKGYSKRVFNQNFEVLRNSTQKTTGRAGYGRYYAKNEFCGDHFLTSQWMEYHWEPLLAWMRRMEQKGE